MKAAAMTASAVAAAAVLAECGSAPGGMSPASTYSPTRRERTGKSVHALAAADAAGRLLAASLPGPPRPGDPGLHVGARPGESGEAAEPRAAPIRSHSLPRFQDAVP